MYVDCRYVVVRSDMIHLELKKQKGTFNQA